MPPAANSKDIISATVFACSDVHSEGLVVVIIE